MCRLLLRVLFSVLLTKGTIQSRPTPVAPLLNKKSEQLPTKTLLAILGGGHLLDSLGSKVQRRLLVLGLARQAVLPGEPQHVLHRVVDAQSAGVVERGAALAVLAGQQDLNAVVLKGWTHQGHTQTT